MISDVPLDADERKIITVKRTSLWLIPLYLVGVAAFVGLLAGVYLIAKNQPTVRQNLPVPMALMMVILAAGLLGLIDYIFIKIYRGNRMILTSERIVLFTQTGLFHQSVPQLNLGDIQEVTVHQHGFLSHLFNYGTIIIETAGEQKNIVLKYALNPHFAVQQIDDASEAHKYKTSHSQPHSV